MIRRIIILLALLSSQGHALLPKIERPDFDLVDDEGYVRYKKTLAQIEITPDLTIPVYLEFSTAPGPRDSLLEQGWSLSITNGYFYVIDRNYIKAVMPWDGSVELKKVDKTFGMSKEEKLKARKKDLNDHDEYSNQDWGWDGKLRSQSSLRLQNSANETYIYKNNKLVEYISAQDDRIEWNYDNDSLRLKKGVRTLMQLREHINSILLDFPHSEDSASYEIRYKSDSPEFELLKNDEPVFQFQSREDGSYALIRPGQDTITLNWNRESGFVNLVSSSKQSWRYSINSTRDDLGYQTFSSISRRGSDGKYELDEFDHIKGIRRTLLNGVETIEHYILMNGPHYHKLRKVEQTTNGRRKVIYQGIYDKKGVLRKSIDGDGNASTYEYDENGEILKIWTNGKLGYLKEQNGQYTVKTIRSKGDRILRITYENKRGDAKVEQLDGSNVIQSAIMPYRKAEYMFESISKRKLP